MLAAHAVFRAEQPQRLICLVNLIREQVQRSGRAPDHKFQAVFSVVGDVDLTAPLQRLLVDLPGAAPSADRIGQHMLYPLEAVPVQDVLGAAFRQTSAVKAGGDRRFDILPAGNIFLMAAAPFPQLAAPQRLREGIPVQIRIFTHRRRPPP